MAALRRETIVRDHLQEKLSKYLFGIVWTYTKITHKNLI